MAAAAAEDAPAAFVCPILYEVMRDPVTTVDGFTFEKRAIERWLCSHRTSPLTGLPLKSLRLTPNRALKAAIEHWLTTPHSRGGPKTPRSLIRTGSSPMDGDARLSSSTRNSPRAAQQSSATFGVAGSSAGGAGAAGIASPRRRPWLPPGAASSPRPGMGSASLPISTSSPRVVSGVVPHPPSSEAPPPVSARRGGAAGGIYATTGGVPGTDAGASGVSSSNNHRTPRMSGAAIPSSSTAATSSPASSSGSSSSSGAAAAGPANSASPGDAAAAAAAGRPGSSSTTTGPMQQQQPDDPSQLPSASAELRNIARLLKASMEHGVPALVRGMRGPDSLADGALQEVACVTLASIVVRNPAVKAEVAEAGGIEAVIDALYAHPLNPGVQEAGCKALANTVANCSSGTEDRAAGAGGLHAVLAALRYHHAAAYVVEAACAALANLTANSTAVRDYAGTQAVEAVLEAMRDYPDNLGVLGAAAQALANLVALNHPAHQRAALVGGGAEAILGLITQLNRNGGSSRTEQVAKAALRAVRNLGASDETAGRLLAEGVAEKVFRCMDTHAFSTAVLEVACQAIANIAVAGAKEEVMRVCSCFTKRHVLPSVLAAALLRLTRRHEHTTYAQSSPVVAVVPPEDEEEDDDLGGPSAAASVSLIVNPAVELIEAGVVEAVGAALRSHPASEAVQTAGLTALLSVMEGIAGPVPPAAPTAAAAPQSRHHHQQHAGAPPAASASGRAGGASSSSRSATAASASSAAAAAGSYAAIYRAHQQQQAQQRLEQEAATAAATRAGVSAPRARGLGVAVRSLARAAARQVPASRDVQTLARQISNLPVV